MHRIACSLQKVADRRTESGVAAMADVQRPGWIRRNKLEQYFRTFLPGLSTAFNAGGLMLVSLFLTIQVRFLFQGPVLSVPGVGDAELYTYSAAWLVYALSLLGLGYVTGRRALRHASMLVILATVGKVFLIDMAGLTGLYRVLSFLGLGLALIGIGYFYQRFDLLTPPGSGPSVEDSA